MKLKDIRVSKGLSQEQAATLIGITRRTYAKYENDENKAVGLKYNFMCQVLYQHGYIDEEHGLLTIERIKELCVNTFQNYNVDFAYIIGSYAKGEETEVSSVDILISLPTESLYDALKEVLGMKLRKKINLYVVSELKENANLIEEILREGIRIYVQNVIL